jgi:hypothetical protein
MLDGKKENKSQQSTGENLNRSIEIQSDNIIDLFDKLKGKRAAFIHYVAEEMVKNEHEEKAFSIAEDIFNALTRLQVARQDQATINELIKSGFLVKTLGFLFSFIDEKWLPGPCIILADKYRFYSANGKLDNPLQPQANMNQRNSNAGNSNNPFNFNGDLSRSEVTPRQQPFFDQPNNPPMFRANQPLALQSFAGSQSQSFRGLIHQQQQLSESQENSGRGGGG